MNRKFQLLVSIHEFARDDTLPMTEYLGEFQGKLGLPIKEILGIYSHLLENNYIKSTSQDRVYITQKGLDTIHSFSNNIMQL